jgi:hypothetical protein
LAKATVWIQVPLLAFRPTKAIYKTLETGNSQT